MRKLLISAAIFAAFTFPAWADEEKTAAPDSAATATPPPPPPSPAPEETAAAAAAPAVPGMMCFMLSPGDLQKAAAALRQISGPGWDWEGTNALLSNLQVQFLREKAKPSQCLTPEAAPKAEKSGAKPKEKKAPAK